MKVRGVDHPLQHVLGALSALREEGKTDVSETEKKCDIVSLCCERQSCSDTQVKTEQTCTEKKFCNAIKEVSLELIHSTVEAMIALVTELSIDSNGEAWRKRVRCRQWKQKVTIWNKG